MTPDNPLPVEQCARDAAAEYGLTYLQWKQAKATNVRLGRIDGMPLVQAIQGAVVIARQSNAGMAYFGASDAACYEYPGEDQQELRDAFCRGAASNVRAQPDREAIARLSEDDIKPILTAMSDALRADARSFDGKCYAHGFTGFCQHEGGWPGEVDGEIDLEPIARAAILATAQSALLGDRAGVIEECARVLDAKAAEHERLQKAADERRPHGNQGKGDWAPGFRWESHGGTASMYAAAAAAIRALATKGSGDE